MDPNSNDSNAPHNYNPNNNQNRDQNNDLSAGSNPPQNNPQDTSPNFSPFSGQKQPQQAQPQQFNQSEYRQPAQPQQLAPAPAVPYGAAQPSSQPSATDENQGKNYLVALLLSYFLGSLGADRFYLEKIGTGILKLITFGGFGLWHLIDLILIAFNKMHAKGDDRPLHGYAENRQWVRILAIVMLVFNVVTIGGLIVLMVLLSAGSTQRSARDTARKSDLNTAVTSIYGYAATHEGKYPTTADVQNGTFKIEGNFSKLKQSDIIYTALPSNCDNVQVNCKSFTLKTQLENGTAYTVNP